MKSLALKKFFIGIYALLFSFNVFCVTRGGQDLILPGHWVYTSLHIVEQEVGRVTFGDQAPVSINELRTYLEDIDYERLSAPGKIHYEKIINYIQDKTWSLNVGVFSIGTEPSVNPEGFYKSNADIPWINDYTKRQALLDVPIKFSISDYLSVYMGLQMSQNYTARFRNDNYFNQFFTIDTLDPVLTHENYLSAGYCWNNNVGVSLVLATGTQSIGNSLMPSIIMSEYLTDAPYLNLRVYSPVFNYDLNVTQLTHQTFFYTHRIEARFFKMINVSVLEGVLPYNTFDLRFINPFGVYHGYGLFNEFPGYCSSYLGFKVSITPCKYLRIYGLYSQNEHTMKSEKDSGDNSTPEGSGFMAGIESYIPAKKGHFHAGVEFYYTNPYLFIKGNPNVSFAKVFGEMVASSPDYYQWVGSPLGPDTLAFQVAFGYEKPSVDAGAWSINCIYNFAAAGEFSGDRIFKNAGWKSNGSYDESAWVYPSNPTYKDGANFSAPHGIVEYRNSLYVCGSWQPLRWLTLSLQPGYTFIYNYGHETGAIRQGFEISFTTKIALTKIPDNPLSVDFLFKDPRDKKTKTESNVNSQ